MLNLSVYDKQTIFLRYVFPQVVSYQLGTSNDLCLNLKHHKKNPKKHKMNFCKVQTSALRVFFLMKQTIASLSGTERAKYDSGCRE